MTPLQHSARRAWSRALLVILVAGCSEDQCHDPAFTATNSRLEMRFSGSGSGRVTSSDGQMDCLSGPGVCSVSYADAVTIDLTGTPQTGSVFVHWTDDCNDQAGNPMAGKLTKTISGVVQCRARFDLVPPNDRDLDGTPDAADNCPTLANPNQADANGDGVGDACANGCFNPVIFSEDFETGDPFTDTFGGNGTQTRTRVTTGGNPGAYRQMTHTVPSGTNLNVDHLNPGVYTPATQGRVLHLEYSEDRIKLSPQTTTDVVGGSFHLVQSGVGRQYVINGVAAFTSLTWEHVQTTFTRSQLVNVNLTDTGTPLQFGYRRSNLNNTSATLNTTHGIDNWQVRVCRDP